MYGVSKRGGKRRQHDIASHTSTQLSSRQREQQNPQDSFIGAPGLNKGNSYISCADVSIGPAIATGYSELFEMSQPLMLYYDNFHGAHPFVLPRESLKLRLNNNPESLTHLVPVMKYVGSIYGTNIDTTSLRGLAYNAVANSSDLPSNGFTVQALLLLAIALHCSDEYKVADHLLERALDVALSIGMNRQTFATAHGETDLVVEESWRRTFWTLFMMDGLFAVINHRQSHRLQHIASDVDLPCEDAEYESQVCLNSIMCVSD